ncbi:MAG: hypothetical protein V4805_06715 [Pseudomonadota bacterium]
MIFKLISNCGKVRQPIQSEQPTGKLLSVDQIMSATCYFAIEGMNNLVLTKANENVELPA